LTCQLWKLASQEEKQQAFPEKGQFASSNAHVEDAQRIAAGAWRSRRHGTLCNQNDRESSVRKRILAVRQSAVPTAACRAFAPLLRCGVAAGGMTSAGSVWLHALVDSQAVCHCEGQSGCATGLVAQCTHSAGHVRLKLRECPAGALNPGAVLASQQ